MQLSVREVAQYLNVSEKTVYRWISEGKVPHHRVDGQYRFNRSDLLEWANERKIKVSTAVYRRDNVDRPVPTLAEALEAGGYYYHARRHELVQVWSGELGEARHVEINREMARRVWPGQDPIGRRIRLGAADSLPWRTVVGIVSDIENPAAGRITHYAYVPFSQAPPGIGGPGGSRPMSASPESTCQCPSARPSSGAQAGS